MSAAHGDDIKKVEFKLPIQMPEGSAVRVDIGDAVKPGDVIAEYKEPDLGEIDILRYFNLKKAADGEKLLNKQKGDSVNVDDVLAEKSSWTGKKMQLKAEYEGVMDDYTDTGLLLIRKGTINHEITSPIGGKVATIKGTELEVETSALHWQGVFGTGTPRWGDLAIWEKNGERLRLEDIDAQVKGKVLLVNSVLQQAFWYKACAMGVAGIVCAELPSNFESWNSAQMEGPAVIAVRNDGEFIPDQMVHTLAKLKHAFVFLLPANAEIVVIDNRP